MALPVPTGCFSSLAPLNQKNGRDYQDGRADKAERLEDNPQPVKHEQIAEAHGDGRHNDDEE